MNADEILQAAWHRIAEIDALFITLAAERVKLRAMVAGVKPNAAGSPLPFLPPSPPVLPVPPLPPQPYMPFFPVDDRYRFTMPVDCLAGGYRDYGDGTFRML